MLDLDNTLADRSGAVSAWIDEFCAERELGAEAAAWLHESDQDGYADRATVFAEIRRRFGLPEPVERLLGDYRRRVVELVRPVDGAVECLTQLRSRGCRLAIVSNGSSGQQHAKIDQLGLRDLVDAVIVSGDLAIKKPDPQIFEAAAEACGGTAGEVWMVGDSPTHDIVGAAALGFKTAWLRRGRVWDASRYAPTVPDLSLDSLRPLPELVSP